MNKEYKIETVQDIYNCITTENIERFMLDFYQLFDTMAQIKEMDKEVDIKNPYFTWIDDGKMNITFDLNGEEKIEIKSK